MSFTFGHQGNIKRQLNIFLILRFSFVTSFSQQGYIVSFEGCAIINGPLIKGERLQSHDQSTSSTDIRSSAFQFK